MEAVTLKRIRTGCMIFAVLWFVVLALFEARYLIKLSRVQPNLRAVFGIAYEEQTQGINFFVMLMYFAPGIFSWFVYRRFRKY